MRAKAAGDYVLRDDVHEDYIAVEEAVIERSRDNFTLGDTKTRTSERYLALTPFHKRP